MKVVVAGTGHVGLSNTILLFPDKQVVAIDINREKVALLNAKQSPTEGVQITSFFYQ